MTPARSAFASEVPTSAPDSLDSAPAGANAQERHTYRGRDLAEVLPQIRAELGPDAVVTHQREGLVGGIGGFFAQRFIEVEAMAAPETGIDFYDGEDAEPDTVEYTTLTPVQLEQSEDETEVGTSFSEALDGVVAVDSDDGFAARLAAASLPASDETDPAVAQPGPASIAGAAAYVAAPEREVIAAPRTPERAQEETEETVPMATPTLRDTAPVLLHSSDPADTAIESTWFAGEAREAGEFLIGRGVSARLAEDLTGEARTHDLPFAGAGGMRDALHACVARRLPRSDGLPRGGALVALVGGGGSGKTRCAAAIAASYRDANALDVRAVVLGRYDSGAQLSALLEPQGVSVQTAERGSRAAAEIASSRGGALVIADTPTVSPADPAGIGMLAVELAVLAPEAVLVTLPATSNTASARQLLAALAPLAPTGIIVTHADETDQLGVAVELSLESRLPIVFIHGGLDLPEALAPAYPNTIAERLLT
jgi:flagellar biosynthesis GTPase FlhF